ncbi:MAG: T9SS type A sorting domain-containing protein [Crocinitomicaceae bacterium]|nr:T9SS type A sorting domain-containing protein [Crocinitomicaceae bacterium]
MKRVIFAFLVTSILAFNGSTQGIVPCGTDEALESLHKEFPILKAEYDTRELLKNSATVINKKGEKAVSYQIPVVFHILHEYGTENIPDALVYDLMNRLNEDYSASNADTANVIPEFKPIIGDAEIQFKLAALDPLGNCTNGIEHIYSHETNFGDVYSKISQWNRSHYLNIWVVHTPNSGGEITGTLLGYATFPSSTDGAGYWVDGIVLRDWTVTGSDRTLTHEVGHYLGLPHTFAGTSAGDGICGDDGIEDTPPTAGSFSTCNLALATCDTAAIPAIENVQNYMDYSSCIHMFTQGQVDVMQNTLESISGQRNILWKDSTLIATGVLDLSLPQDPSNPLTVPLCVPVPDYTASTRQTCIGATVNFSDASWNAAIESYNWTFEDGSPSTSSSTNPSVSFISSGYKNVTLSVTNAAGTGTETRTGYIYVSQDYATFDGPTSINLEEASANWFVTNNFEDNYGKFALSNGTGYGNSTSYKLTNFKDVAGADLFNNDFFYNNRLGGSVDELITPSFDLRYTSGATMSFKYSYATNATQINQITEFVKVYVSTDCGETWISRQISVDGSPVGSISTGLTGSNLVTGGFAGNTDYAPTSNNDWRTASVNINTTAASDKVMFKIQFTASDLASNFYVDDINVGGTLGLTTDGISALELNVFPNPSHGEAINISYTAQNEPVTFTLRDSQGKILSIETVEATNTIVNKALNNTTSLPSACYFLEVTSGDNTTIKKLIVL